MSIITTNIVATIDGVQNPTVSVVGVQGLNANQLGGLSSLSDIDMTNLQNGSVLVYNSSASKWTSTRNLNLQNIDAGEF